MVAICAAAAAAALVLSSSTLHASAFQFGTVASTRGGATRPAPSPSASPTFPPTPTSRRSTASAAASSATISQEGGVTSSLISQLAVVALKLRLASQIGVKCDVTASSSELLLRGRVGPVTVRGRGWESQLGLTCSAIEATVGRCDLDMGTLVSKRKLVLTTPARGDAMIAMNGEDFASFISHPLMKPPTAPLATRRDGGGEEDTIRFVKEGVRIDPSDGDGGGTVVFYIIYMGDRWRCALKRGDGSHRGRQGAVISVTPSGSGSSINVGNHELGSIPAKLAEAMSAFFNEMVFELDGTFLSFRDMMITKKGGAPSVMLALAITVKKFPSPGLAF